MRVELVVGWTKLWKAASMQLAALGIILPELLQLIADNSDLFSGLDAGWKSGIRMACLAGVILVRPVRQASLVVEPQGVRDDA